MTQDELKHLMLRAGFGLSQFQEKKFFGKNRSIILDDLIRNGKNLKPLKNPVKDFKKVDPKSMSKKEKSMMRKEARKKVTSINSDWVHRMATAENDALGEKMCLFWHGHFACEIKNPVLAYPYLNALRNHGLGNFRDLVKAISKTGAMIRYLNNQQNRKNRPNENFARELMELFTIGRGNYTEKDISEAARAFTGWTSNFFTGEFTFQKRRHDFGSKQFMGRSGKFGGEDIIEMILEKKQTAQFITIKVANYFLGVTPSHSNLNAWANSFYQSDYDIPTLLRAILGSQYFYNSEVVGKKIKSPVEFLAGTMRILGLNFKKTNTLISFQRGLGQVLFDPPNVAGWPGGRSWIDSGTLILRLNVPAVIFRKMDSAIRMKSLPEQNLFKKFTEVDDEIDLQKLIAPYIKLKPEQAYHEIASQYLAVSPSVPFSTVRKFIDKRDDSNAIQDLFMRIMMMPEYQMC